MENKDIELRSDQVRKIIGQIPPVLIRSGMGIIGIIVALLLVVAAFVPYPETVDCNIIVTSTQENEALAIGELPYAYIAQIKNGMKAEVELEGYTSKEYGYQEGYLTMVSPKTINRNGQNYFNVTLSLKEIPFIQKGMKGKAFILLSDRTLFERIFE